MGIKRASLRKKNLMDKDLILLILANLFLFVFLPTGLKGEDSSRTTFVVELKEWLVMEIVSGPTRVEAQNHSLAVLQTEIISGEPVEVRALLSVSPERTVVLKGTIYDSEFSSLGSGQLKWVGEGDISGRGEVNLNQENIFATWRGPGFKKGTLIFYGPEQNGTRGEKWVANFVLSAI